MLQLYILYKKYKNTRNHILIYIVSHMKNIEDSTNDVIIIGAGPVGLFAAFQAGIFEMKCTVIDSCHTVGGQCAHLYPDKMIYDIPAFTKIKAIDLINNLKAQADTFNTKYYLSETVIDIKQNNNNDIHTDGNTPISADYIYSVTTKSGIVLYTRSVILAVGGGAFDSNKLCIPNTNIEKFEDHSIFYSVSKKEIFQNKNVAIVGGGDAAVDWAITLAKFASNVYFIHRRDKLRCIPANQSILQELIKEGYIIPIIPYQISNISGINEQIKKVSLLSFNKKLLQKDIEVDYLLAFLGLKNDFTFMKNWGIQVEKERIHVQQHSCETNLKMVYAIGDVSYYEGKMKLILTGFAEAASACHHIFTKIHRNPTFNFQHSTNKAYMFEV